MGIDWAAILVVETARSKILNIKNVSLLTISTPNMGKPCLFGVFKNEKWCVDLHCFNWISHTFSGHLPPFTELFLSNPLNFIL